VGLAGSVWGAQLSQRDSGHGSRTSMMAMASRHSPLTAVGDADRGDGKLGVYAVTHKSPRQTTHTHTRPTLRQLQRQRIGGHHRPARVCLGDTCCRGTLPYARQTHNCAKHRLEASCRPSVTRNTREPLHATPARWRAKTAHEAHTHRRPVRAPQLLSRSCQPHTQAGRATALLSCTGCNP
jgi:hypothetical protein